MPGQRNTSERRRSQRTGKVYRGAPREGQKIEYGPMAVAADYPGAVRCPECETWLKPGTRGSMPRHSRFGFQATGAKPECAGWVRQAGTTAPDEEKAWMAARAMAAGLVTEKWIKLEYGMGPTALKHAKALPGWPECAGRLEDVGGRPRVFPERAVRAVLTGRRGKELLARYNKRDTLEGGE